MATIEGSEWEDDRRLPFSTNEHEDEALRRELEDMKRAETPPAHPVGKCKDRWCACQGNMGVR